MKVLGVDPGLTRCGIGVVESANRHSIVAVDVDVIRTPSDMDLSQRLMIIADAIDQWLDIHNPDVVAIERVFSQHNVRTVMGTAQAGGIVALAAARRGIPVHFHTPSEVKAAVTGNGRAEKEQVTAMVTRILVMQQKPRPADAADALALAICHCWRGPGLAHVDNTSTHAREQIVKAQSAAKELKKQYQQKVKLDQKKQAG